MAFLVDTSVLARLANVADPDFAVADFAVKQLHHRSELLHITPQNLVEFRNVATRGRILNGLGMTIPDTEQKAADFEALFQLLPETADIFPAWKSIVSGLGVVGKQVHDARLVAVCQVNAVSHILTFNTGHFTTLAAFGPGIIVVDPANV